MSALATIARPAVALLAAAAALGLAPLSAAAQSACGDSYTVRPGDTLARIAARCGTSVGALAGANPFIRDPSRIEVGWRLTVPGGYAPSPLAAAPAPYPPTPAPAYPAPVAPAARDSFLDGYGTGTYAVQPGDSFSAIAQALGVSLAALLAQNSTTDPGRLSVGQLLRLPSGYDRRYGDRRDWRTERRNEDRWYEDDDARLSVKPAKGKPGTKVELRVAEVDRGEWLAFGVRDGRGGVVKLAEARADSKGRAKAKVRVPDWADRRDDLVFVAKRQDGRILRSGRFDVTGGMAEDRDERRDRRRARRGTVEGWVVRGVECPVLRTPSGTSYSLVSDDVRLPLGAYVEIEGRPVRYSTCMEGAGTIDVSELRRVDPPR